MTTLISYAAPFQRMHESANDPNSLGQAAVALHPKITVSADDVALGDLRQSMRFLLRLSEERGPVERVQADVRCC
ncbi:hypothetical protein DOU09_05940 [Clavibacter michiganensis subsp. michiganensis]|nr:hypothetical protein [Clavibacter michiganensis subsp. michiganensis]MWJ04657.1 hypothetical protein [Clavibacter michiganensis subsp. michiganensis]MWJ09352.1 hypothetical protein [Clavibacter michiganensis subsp. michiganensis]MWJ13672.1 hypothetical protein [Clavibacter michiganensis subsp. michiganensis]MWJ16106.1 hypothetical protein [Clavibacter michiganensis subsp. michiganensis]